MKPSLVLVIVAVLGGLAIQGCAGTQPNRHWSDAYYYGKPTVREAEQVEGRAGARRSAESYEVVIKIHLDGNQWGAVVGKDLIEGVAGFGYTANEAMVELTKQMDLYHRNWEEFAEPD